MNSPLAASALIATPSNSHAWRNTTIDHSGTPLMSLPFPLALDDRISPHFRIKELVRSEIAQRQQIDNSVPSIQCLRAAVHLAREVLEPIRATFGPFSPNSVFRCQELERKLKKKSWAWVSSSQHTLGEAADLEIPGVSTLELARWCADALPAYDQLICECYRPGDGPNSGWVHVSLRAPGSAQANRGEQLSYVWDVRARKFVYVRGMTELS